MEDLNDWLVGRALTCQPDGAARTFVAKLGQRVTGYYAFTVASVMHLDAPGNLRRNMRDPVPVALLARLAVDRSVQGKGAGGGLLRDAVQRTLIASENLGIRGMMIHALSPAARSFYEHFGFRRSPANDMTLMATLQTLGRVFRQKSNQRNQDTRSFGRCQSRPWRRKTAWCGTTPWRGFPGR